MMQNDVQNRNDVWQKIGIVIFCLYIAAMFLANDVLLPRAVSSITLYLFLGYSVIVVFINGKIKVSTISLWMLGVMAFSLISMLYSMEKDILSGTYYTLIVNFIIIFLLTQYDLNEKAINMIGWTNILVSLIMVIALIATGNIVDTSESGRLGETLSGGANVFAALLMISQFFGLWFLVYLKKKIFHRILIIASIALNYVALFLSGGRKYIIIPVIFLYVLLIFKQDRKGRKHFIKYTVIIIAIVLAMYLIIMKVPMFYDVIGVRIEGFFAFISGNEMEADASSILRDKMIEGAFNGWLTSPIWGHGFDSFKYYNKEITGYAVYSHNNFLEMLFNTGIIGFILYYWYYIYIVRKAWKSKGAIPGYVRAFAIALIVCMLVFEYGGINYTSATTMILFCLVNSMLNTENKSIE